MELARSQVANLVGADPDEIVFTSGATEANNLAIKGFSIADNKQRRRNKILVSATEHKCVLESAAYVARIHGYSMLEIPVDRKGYVDLEILSKMLTEDVLLVSIALVNNEIGTIQNIEVIAKLCREVGAIFHSDFAQAPSAVDLSIYVDSADAVSLSGHKFGGPMGIGALYVSRVLRNDLEPLFHGGGQEAGLRSGTLALPLCVGLGSAAEFAASDDGAASRERISHLRDRFVNGLQSESPHIFLNGEDLDLRHPGNANLKFDGYDADNILQRLQPIVSASTGSACSSGVTDPSYVLQAIGLTCNEAQSSIRFSFGHTNTSEDVQSATDALLALL